MKNIKKKIERFNLDRFIEVINLPIDVVEETEEPDFLCTFKDTVLGIELTSLKNKQLSERCGIQNKIDQNAKQMSENDLPPIEVTVWFSSTHNRYNGKEKKEAISYIHDKVKKQIDEIRKNNGSPTKIRIEQNRYGLHQIYARWSYVNGTNWLEHHRWQTSEPGWVSFDFYSELQARISEKNIKYSTYRSKCEKCWLIVTVDRSRRDEMFEFEGDMDGKVFKSNFDSVYFFDIMLRRIYKLTVQ